MPFQERWVIDELTESTATLLRSRFLGPIAAAIPPEQPEVPEAARLSQLWSDEADHVLDRTLVEAYIREEAARSSGQAPRDLREGDVYLVTSTEAIAVDAFVRPEQTTRFIRACRRARAVISDATAVARQVSSMSYRQALAQASVIPEPR